MSGPLHARIRGGIEARILGGTLAPGDRLPTEAELMREHGCARMTVSKALSALAAAGLIERRKKAGSFVARPRVRAMVLDVPDLAGQVNARGQAYAWELLDRTVRAAELPDERTLAGSGRILAVRGLHFADGVPLAIEDRCVALATVPAIEAVDLAVTAPGGWLLEHVPWTAAETRIAAVIADRESADRLDVEAGAACLVVERTTWRGDRPVTRVRQQFVGAAYDLVARFGPDSR